MNQEDNTIGKYSYYVTHNYLSRATSLDLTICCEESTDENVFIKKIEEILGGRLPLQK